MHLLGAFGRVLAPGIASGDLVVPTVTTKLFPNWMAGIILAGPLAAVMSTVDSQLLLAVGAIVNDIYANLINPNIKRTAAFAFASTLAIGLAVYFWALDPPDLMVWLNLYAHAGIIATFLWPLILGIYWKRANAWGALASIVTGVGTYIWFNTDKIWPYGWTRPFGLHVIVVPLAISLAAFVLVSWRTARPPDRIIAKFWGV
jgi:sodium/pantothenate symporter